MSPDIRAARSLEAMIRAGAAALAGASTPRLDARVLARHALGLTDAGLIARATDPVPERDKERFAEFVLRRARGEPVAYIVGEKEFWGMTFQVTPEVLIPRADSECLVEALAGSRPRARALRLLDIGSGSGCLLCALLAEFPHANGVGVEGAPGAAAIARDNVRRLGFDSRAAIVVSDWLAGIAGQFDMIVANAPYVPETDRGRLIVDVSDYEPEMALYGGEDGLDAYRAIFPAAAAHGAPDAVMAVEYGSAAQGERLREMARVTFPGAALRTVFDLAGRERGLVVDLAGPDGADAGQKKD